MEFEFITDGNRPSAPVKDQPSIVLARWAVMQVSTSARFLVGERTDVRTWRRSTPILQLLAAERVAITTSGRRYVLEGPPASTAEDAELIQRVLECHGIPRATNVTASHWAAMLDAAR